MTYRTYKITSRTTYGNYIAFELDGYVEFSGGSRAQRIDCVNGSPFSNWYAGDYVEIDNNKTRNYSSGKDFYETDIIHKTTLAVAHGRTVARELIHHVDSQAAGKAELEHKITFPDGSTSQYTYRKNW